MEIFPITRFSYDRQVNLAALVRNVSTFEIPQHTDFFQQADSNPSLLAQKTPLLWIKFFLYEA